MKELVIISGKGGSGKTSVAASFAVLAKQAVIADCDVDAADLHLLLTPQINERHQFCSGNKAVIRQNDCIGCGACLAHCRFEAVVRMPMTFGTNSVCKDCEFCVRSCPVRVNEMIRAMRESCGYQGEEAAFYIDPVACEGCGVCVQFCPVQAIDFPERHCGEWMVSDTRCGPMVHAQLSIAAENSGKLVSTVRREARRIAEERHHELIIVDGPPGIGCPVIASITGSDLVLAVTEPTPSGEHDLKRVVQLSRHFGIPMAVCINKWDLNEEMYGQIEAFCNEQSIPVAGKIRYDRAFTRTQIQGQALVEAEEHGAAADIRNLWDAIYSPLLQLSHHAARV